DDQTVTLVDEPNGPAGRSWVYVDGILTNVELVARGVVTVDAAGLTMYEELKAAERSAQEAAIGIWGDADSN
ncbi:MAG: thermonuclease family protein, partial [Acidimicrobiia bacterium]|nr:thermonuclease family protein [Acidimicrobiia bacterium]